MNDIEKLLLLMDLGKKLKYNQYDKFGLLNLDRLRSEVEIEIAKLRKNKGKSEK